MTERIWRRSSGLVVSGLVTPTAGHFALPDDGRAKLRALS